MERRIGTVQGWREGWVQIKELKKGNRYRSRIEEKDGTDQGIEEKDRYRSRILRIGTDQGHKRRIVQIKELKRRICTNQGY